MAKLGAAAGTFLGGAAMARYGRQRALALNSAAFVAGPVIMAAATAPWMLVLGRFVVGLGVGISATVSPAYIAELAPAATRGMLVQLYEVMLCIGMLLAPLMDWVLSRVDSEGSWRAMVGLPALPGMLLAAAPLLLPESPRWLVTRGRLDEALAVIKMVVRGSGGWSRGPQALWSGGYSRMDDQDKEDDQTVRDAEDELLQLWSCVQMDRNVVLEQRRKLWRSRQQRGGRRWGRLGCWNGAQGRPRAPSLDPIPEESSSHVPSPSCLSPSASIAATSNVVAIAAAAVASVAGTGTNGGDGGDAGPCGSGGGGRANPLGHSRLPVSAPASASGPSAAFPISGGAQLGFPTHGSLSSLREHWQQLPAACDGSSSGGMSTGIGTDAGNGGAGGELVAGGGGAAAGRVLGLPRREAEGGWPHMAAEGTYRPLASCDEAGADLQCGAPGSGSDERTRLLAPERSRTEAIAVSEQPEADAGGSSSPFLLPPSSSSSGALSLSASVPSLSCGSPPACLADMPGEEPSFFRTLSVLIGDIGALAVGPERRALWLALGLAFFDQATAATAIINYAPTLLKRLDEGGGGGKGAGEFDEGSAMLYTVLIGLTKAVGVVAAMLLVDHCGRRPLLLAGSLACAASLGALTLAALAGSTALLELAMCGFTLFFSLSWAGLYWVVVSELFSMSAKSAATSAATGLLFLTGALTDLVFLSLHDLMGPHTFLLFAALCLAAAAYVAVLLPETKGRTLAEVQALLAAAGGRGNAGEAAEGGAGEGRGGRGRRRGAGGSIELWRLRW
ncbi:hypothetical protein PLESTF_000469900 [Pleodorina starrii]|nr:hypothetical protein PLESTF_000469900 [Pleodorina starrii]